MKNLYSSAGVDPNFAADETSKRPVLLAAEKGHWRVLQAFKKYNFDQISLGSTGFKRNMVNFAVWTRNSDETVLHLVLRKPNYKLHQVMLMHSYVALTVTIPGIRLHTVIMTKLHIFQTLDNFDRHANSNKHKIGKRAKEMDKNYSKCLNVLLSKTVTNLKGDSSVGHEEFMKQIRMIINKRDDRYNTPLHYATLNWPQQTVRKLLNNGANVGMKNIREEIPLSRINPDTLQDFLDENCMVADGYDLEDDDEIDTDEDLAKVINDEEEEIENIHCDPDFFTNLN